MYKIFFLIVISFFMMPISVLGMNSSELISNNTTSAILVEESTGQVLFEKNKNKEVAVASMTKMMSQIIILESIEAGTIKWNDIVTVSKNASDMGGSQIYLQVNEKMSVRDLFKGISMASANDATVALAEYIAGSEENFVKIMNKKIKTLGLKNTHFENSTGLDENNHYSSAFDMGIIARELLTHEAILKFSSVYEDYLRKDTPNKFWLVNTNKLVRFYDKADGLKTGHTDNAKYCIAATAKRNNLRLIAIVLGSESAKVRNEEAAKLLDYGFNNTQYKLFFKKNQVIKNIKVVNGNKKYLKISPIRDVIFIYQKQDNIKNIKYSIKIKDIKLPIKRESIIGNVIIKKKNKVIDKVPLKANNSIRKLTFMEVFFNNLKSLVY